MLRLLGQRLTYANVMSTLALFVALGGTTYAVTGIGSSEIRNNSVRSVDLRNNDVRGRDVRRRSLSGSDIGENRIGGGAIKESTLGKVPTAARADRVGGFTGEELKLRCPAFSTGVAGVCVEFAASPARTWDQASLDCKTRNRQLTPYVVLREFFGGSLEPTAGGEWTSDVFESRGSPGQLDTVILTTPSGGTTFGPAVSPAARGYRCMAQPTN